MSPVLSAGVRFFVVVVAGTALVLAVAWLGSTVLRRVRVRPSGASAVGWALLFLSFGKMPPPPPASQIELDLNARKDRSLSRQDDSLP